MDDLSFADLFPPDLSIPRRIYCDICGKHTRLREALFDRRVSGVRIVVNGLLELHCTNCDKAYWPDHTRLALMRLWERASEASKDYIQVTRRKRVEDFGFTKVKFVYDADDYFFIPGLARENSPGFLTPVFFNKHVLIKFDALEHYSLSFCSRTYGGISTQDFSISFGVNENEKVVMWLGDIAELPEPEQHYLRSENIPSDHCLGSEFYDGQIECKFTDPTAEDRLVEQRSDFLQISRLYFGSALSCLDQEILVAISEWVPPVNFGAKERRYVCDTLNRICVESLSLHALRIQLKNRGVEPEKMGSLKMLQRLLELVFAKADIAQILSPLFVVYDLRVIHSHLTSDERLDEVMAFCRERLLLEHNANFEQVYHELTKRCGDCYARLTNLFKSQL